MGYTIYVGCDTCNYTPEYVRSIVDRLLDPEFTDTEAKADVVAAINLLPLRDRRVLALVARGFGPVEIAQKVYGNRKRPTAVEHTKRALSTVSRLLNGEKIPGVNAPGKRRGRPVANSTYRA